MTTIGRDGSRVFLFPADARGRFTRARQVSALVLVAVYLLLPWIPINGYPAVLLDVAHRRFHFFGHTLAAQDAWLLFFAVSGLGFALFFLTALFGRLWCGWACPHTVFLDHVYRRIERWIEGDAPRRRQRRAAPASVGKVVRSAVKHALYGIASLAIAHLFLAYFVSIPELWQMMRSAPAEHASAFGFVFGLAALLHFNFAWFREQMCIVLCPYGRLQSTLTDEHSLVIGYDALRGEPRARKRRQEAGERRQEAGERRQEAGERRQETGERRREKGEWRQETVDGRQEAGERRREMPARSSASFALSPASAGACIDCSRCVQVCPTGIDIRHGLQLECIGCAACIDACDEVMAKVGRPSGLIRYDSLAGFSGRPTRWLRPRTVLYGVLLVAGAAAATYAFSTVRPVAISVVRMAGAAYYVDATSVRNQLLVRLLNKRATDETFIVTVEQLPEGVASAGFEQPLTLPPMGEQVAPLVLRADRARYAGPFPFTVRVRDEAGTYELEREGRFVGPDPKLLNEERGEQEITHRE